MAAGRGGGADAIIVGAISEAGLAKKFEEAIAAGTPVISTVNPVSDAKTTAKMFVEFDTMGEQTGTYLKDFLGDKEAKVVNFPGPAGSGWAESFNDGFKKAIAGDDKIELLDEKFGDSGVAVQMQLIQDALQAYPEMTVIWGTAPTAEAAIAAVAEVGRDLIRPRDVPVDHCHHRAVAGERPRRRGADAGGRTRDRGHPARRSGDHHFGRTVTRPSVPPWSVHPPMDCRDANSAYLASLSRSSSTPRPGPVGTAMAPSSIGTRPPAITSSTRGGECVPIATGGVGGTAARSIGEPGTQLTMRTFHIGGTAQVVDQSTMESNFEGTVHIRNRNLMRDSEGRLVAMGRTMQIAIVDSDGTERSVNRITYGSRPHVDEGDVVTRGQRLAEWDP